MSLALAPHEIRVNAIGPGSIQTQVLQAVATNEAAKNRQAFHLKEGLVCCMACMHTSAVVPSSHPGEQPSTNRSFYVGGTMQQAMHLQAGPSVGRIESPDQKLPLIWRACAGYSPGRLWGGLGIQMRLGKLQSSWRRPPHHISQVC